MTFPWTPPRGYLVNCRSGYGIGSTAIALDYGDGVLSCRTRVRFVGDPNAYTVDVAHRPGGDRGPWEPAAGWDGQ